MITQTQLADLEAKAKAARDWVNVRCPCCDDSISDMQCICTASWDDEKLFNRAANPVVILEILEGIKTLQAEVEKLLNEQMIMSNDLHKFFMSQKE